MCPALFSVKVVLMKLTRAQMRYILAVYRLSENTKSVRPSDIAKYLGFARPSVSRMLGVLTELGLLDRNSTATIFFTEAGRATAEELRKTAEDLGSRLREALDLTAEAAEACALLLLAELRENAG